MTFTRKHWIEYRSERSTYEAVRSGRYTLARLNWLIWQANNRSWN